MPSDIIPFHRYTGDGAINRWDHICRFLLIMRYLFCTPLAGLLTRLTKISTGHSDITSGAMASLLLISLVFLVGDDVRKNYVDDVTSVARRVDAGRDAVARTDRVAGSRRRRDAGADGPGRWVAATPWRGRGWTGSLGRGDAVARTRTDLGGVDADGGVDPRDSPQAITIGAFIGISDATVLQTTHVPLCCVLGVGWRLLLGPFFLGFAGKEAFISFTAVATRAARVGVVASAWSPRTIRRRCGVAATCPRTTRHRGGGPARGRRFKALAPRNDTIFAR